MHRYRGALPSTHVPQVYGGGTVKEGHQAGDDDCCQAVVGHVLEDGGQEQQHKADDDAADELGQGGLGADLVVHSRPVAAHQTISIHGMLFGLQRQTRKSCMQVGIAAVHMTCGS
jgi:hypothetical protein